MTSSVTLLTKIIRMIRSITIITTDIIDVYFFPLIGPVKE